jgi:hypothetical protein
MDELENSLLYRVALALGPKNNSKNKLIALATGGIPNHWEQPDIAKASTNVPTSHKKIDFAKLAIGGTPEQKLWLRRGRAAAAARRRNIIERQKRRLEARLADRRASWKPSRGGPAARFPRSLGDRILCAMEPGDWYSVRELAELVGVNYRSIQPWIYGAGNCRGLGGLIQKGRNAAFVRPLSSWQHMGGLECEPRYLWRLTHAGERARELALILE